MTIWRAARSQLLDFSCPKAQCQNKVKLFFQSYQGSGLFLFDQVYTITQLFLSNFLMKFVKNCHGVSEENTTFVHCSWHFSNGKISSKPQTGKENSHSVLDLGTSLWSTIRHTATPLKRDCKSYKNSKEHKGKACSCKKGPEKGTVKVYSFPHLDTACNFNTEIFLSLRRSAHRDYVKIQQINIYSNLDITTLF